MARRSTQTAGTTEAPAPVQEDTVSTETEAVEAETNEVAPEAPATEAPEAEGEPDLTAFNAAVETAIEARDEATGDIAEAPMAGVTKAYRELDGLKAKNAARKVIDEAMKSAMNDMNIGLARAYLGIQKVALVAQSSGGSGKSTPKAPVDPTEAHVQKVAGLRLALNLAQGITPEGVKEDWADTAKQAITDNTEKAEAVVAWLQSDAEDKGDQPEAPAWVVAAAKLALGKAAKVGGTRTSSTGTPYTGERRDIAKHITEALQAAGAGEFQTIAQIRAFKSEEYGENPPSAGAISARLFPGDDKPTTVKGVNAVIEDGKKGARLAA